MGKVAGLMFADDIVGLAPGRRKLVGMADHLGGWAADNEMTAGIPKCGVMVIGGSMELLERTPSRWMLSGQQLPIVEECKYMGMNIGRSLHIPDMVASRLKSGKKLVGAVHSSLRCRNIPLPMKVSVVRGVLIPILLYGAEVYGMNTKITSSMQVLVNQALRLLVGVNT